MKNKKLFEYVILKPLKNGCIIDVVGQEKSNLFWYEEENRIILPTCRRVIPKKLFKDFLK